MEKVEKSEQNDNSSEPVYKHRTSILSKLGPKGNNFDDLSLKKEESIDSAVKLSNLNEQVTEDVKESKQERKMRRTTLQNGFLRESHKPEIFPSSIDIRNLQGNIFLKGKFEFRKVDAVKLHQSDMNMLNKIRASFRRVNSYCEVFNTKAEILLSILLDLLSKYNEEANRKIYFYGRLKDVYAPWMTIVLNQFANNIALVESKKFESERKKHASHFGDMGGLNFSSAGKGGNAERVRACSRNLAFDTSSVLKLIEMDQQAEDELKNGQNGENTLISTEDDDEEDLTSVRRSRSFYASPSKECLQIEDTASSGERKSRSVEYEFFEESECTRLAFLKKYKQVLKANKEVVEELNRWKGQLWTRINNILNKGAIKDILVMLNNILKEFSATYSKNVRWLIEGEQIFNNLKPDKNLFILEMKMCTLMKQFRTAVDHNLIETISCFNKEILSILLPHSQYLVEESKKLNNIGKVLYGKNNWNSFPLKNALISHLFKPLNMFEIISPKFRKYMKLKLNLQKDSQVTNEDLLDFFKFYKIKYLKQSPFLVNYLICQNKLNPDTSFNDYSILCLDVSKNLIFFRFLGTSVYCKKKLKAIWKFRVL
jgi:hypothetical protein